MAVIRRNPGLSALIGAVLIGLAITLVVWTRTEARAQSGYDPLPPVAASQVAQLLRDAGLDNDALACLNLAAPPLETLLGAVRGWYETHGGEWQAAWTAVADQQARIRYLEAEVNLGHGQQEALATARQQLSALKAAYEAQLANVRSAGLAGLSDSQQALLTRLRSRAQVAMPFRTLDLTDAQDAALTQATVGYHQRLALAHDADTRTALENQYAQDVAAVIGAGNVRALTALRDYLGAASERVVAALQQVFPAQPEE